MRREHVRRASTIIGTRVAVGPQRESGMVENDQLLMHMPLYTMYLYQVWYIHSCITLVNNLFDD